MRSHHISKILFLLVVLTSFPAQAEVITVNQGEDLQAAIDAASSGDTLLVLAGTYRSNIIVPINLTLLGEGQPVIDGMSALNRDTVTLLADGIRFEGFTVTNSTRAGINVSSNETVIRGNDIIHNDRFGIAIYRVSGTLIEENICRDSHGTLNNLGYALYLSSSPETRIRNNTLSESNRDGIYLLDSPSVEITGNAIDLNERYGIYARYCSFLHLEGNHISSNGAAMGTGYGLRVEHSHAIRVVQSTLYNNLLYGMYLNNVSSSTIESSFISGTSTGFFLTQTENATFREMTIENTAIGVDLSTAGKSVPNRIYGSQFMSNTVQVRSADSSTLWNSSAPIFYRYEGRYFENYTGNYWDTYPGTDGDADGIGDEPYTIGSGLTDSYPLAAPLLLYEWNPDPPDVTPPAAITNLTLVSSLPTSLSWNWNDPFEPDLDHIEVYFDGSFLGNCSAGTEHYSKENLAPSTTYTLSLLTVDGAGNRNNTWVNSTAITAAPSETLTPSPTETHPADQVTTRTTSSPKKSKNTRYTPPPPRSIPPEVKPEIPGVGTSVPNTPPPTAPAIDDITTLSDRSSAAPQEQASLPWIGNTAGSFLFLSLALLAILYWRKMRG
jgi:nitrous oxidase accessory protein